MTIHEQAKAAIVGTFADLKTVKTRSVVQMVIEIPIEQGAMIIDAFGFPRPGEEVPVAVARLDMNSAQPAPAPPEKVKRPFHELSSKEQAGIRCGDVQFRQFACWKFNPTAPAGHLPDIEWTTNQVRAWCDVDSRREFDTNTTAAERWQLLNLEFEQWANLVPEQRG